VRGYHHLSTVNNSNRALPTGPTLALPRPCSERGWRPARENITPHSSKFATPSPCLAQLSWNIATSVPPFSADYHIWQSPFSRVHELLLPPLLARDTSWCPFQTIVSRAITSLFAQEILPGQNQSLVALAPPCLPSGEVTDMRGHMQAGREREAACCRTSSHVFYKQVMLRL
jgi:hypothetical protein